VSGPLAGYTADTDDGCTIDIDVAPWPDDEDYDFAIRIRIPEAGDDDEPDLVQELIVDREVATHLVLGLVSLLASRNVWKGN
jgi:hypothetical protein